jgi:hypothetical protein
MRKESWVEGDERGKSIVRWRREDSQVRKVMNKRGV